MVTELVSEGNETFKNVISPMTKVSVARKETVGTVVGDVVKETETGLTGMLVGALVTVSTLLLLTVCVLVKTGTWMVVEVIAQFT